MYKLGDSQSDTCPPITISCLDPGNTPSGELTNEEKMALANVLDAEMRKKLGVETLGVDLKPDVKGLLEEISLKVAIKKIFPGLGHSDFVANIKVKELLNDKRSVSFDATMSSTRVFSEGHHLTLGGRFVLNGIEMKEDGQIESVEAMGFLRHQYTFNNGLKLNSALFVGAALRVPTNNHFVNIGAQLSAELNKLTTITATATGTIPLFGLDGSRAFELRLGVKHYIKTVPIFGRPGKIFVGMNAGFDTGVSMLNMGDGFVTHPSFAAPPDFAPSNTGDFRAVISTGVMW